MTTHYLKQCRPDTEETEYFWKLFHAAQRNDARWHGSEIDFIAEELSRTDLDRKQKLFLLRAWQVLIDDKGGFGRFMGAFDTYVYNMQDPEDDCVAWKPELSKLLQDGSLLYVVLEAYREAHQRIADLENDEVRQRLANTEHQLYMAELAKHNLKASRKAQFRKRLAAEKRTAELEAELETADKLQDSAFRHGLQHGFSYGQTNNQAGFEQCIAAYSSQRK